MKGKHIFTWLWPDEPTYSALPLPFGLREFFFFFLHDLLSGLTKTLGDSSLDFIYAAVHCGWQWPRIMWDRNPISLNSGTWRLQVPASQNTIAHEYSEDLWDFDQKHVTLQLRQLLVASITLPFRSQICVLDKHSL